MMESKLKYTGDIKRKIRKVGMALLKMPGQDML